VWFFPEDIATDQPERQIAAEVIREKPLRLLSDEIPHGTAVMIEEFKEEEDIIRIRAEIFCEKQSHKGIIVGKGGETLKKIGTYAREDLERFFGIKVYLNLWVKVKEKWRDSDMSLNNFGFNLKNLE
jgi:GTP-binding protein Era